MLAVALAALALTGAVDDPVDGAGTPAQDIVHASSSFDSAAGSWTLTLRMRAPVTAADSARVHGILYREDPSRPGVCPSDDSNAELGRLEADTGTAQANGDEVTVSTTSPALVDAHAVCATASLSKGRPLDVLDRPIILQAGFTPPPPPDGDETPAAAPVIKLDSRIARVRGRYAFVRLKPFAARTTVSIGGAARGSRTVAAGRAVKVRVKLGAAARRKLAHHRRVRAKLAVSALQVGAPRASRRLRVTLAR